MKKRNRTHHVWGAFLRIHLNPAGSLSKDRTPVTPAQKKKVSCSSSRKLHSAWLNGPTIDSRTWLFIEPFSLGAWKLLLPFPKRKAKKWVGSSPTITWWLSWMLVIPVMVTYWGLDWALFTKRLYCGMHGCTTWPNNHKTTNSVKVWYLEISVDVTPNFWTALPQQLSHTPQLILSTGDTTPQASYIDLASTFL